MTGTVVCVRTDKSFGFIRPDERGSNDAFFHANDLERGLDFDALLMEARVSFDLDSSGPRGPRARNVRLASY